MEKSCESGYVISSEGPVERTCGSFPAASLDNTAEIGLKNVHVTRDHRDKLNRLPPGPVAGYVSPLEPACSGSTHDP